MNIRHPGYIIVVTVIVLAAVLLLPQSSLAVPAMTQGPGSEDVSIGNNDPIVATASATRVVAGNTHTCALTSEGGVKCWGFNSYGQLGDGTTTDQATPVDVVGLGSGVIALAAGKYHTCALTSGGGVKCWGDNGSGQLGDGTTADQATPVDVVGLGSGVIALAAGGYHTCALTSEGGVKCWGYNSDGQLGDGTTTSRAIPVDVVGLGSGMIALTAGNTHTCALTSNGGVKCWGDNETFQLGDGTNTNRLTLVDVVGLGSGMIALTAGGHHTCALTSSGGVKCGGGNWSGQLGDGTTTDRATPVDLVGLSSGVIALTAGGGGYGEGGYYGGHTCALTSSGGVKCWGDNETFQLGDGTNTNRLTLVDVVGLGSGMIALTAGEYHTCAVTGGGGVKCWGANWFGQLGDGTTTDQATPVDVVGLGVGASGIEISPVTKNSCYSVTNQSTNAGAYTHVFYNALSGGSVIHALNDTLPASGAKVYKVAEMSAIPSGYTGRVVIQADQPSAGSLVPCSGGDTTPPAAITNLAASTGSTGGTINLTWTAPGDDGNTGTATTYIVRRRNSSITNETAWNAATDVSGEPQPAAAGRSQRMTVSGLTPGQTYHFAIKTQDEVPNTSGLSNSVSAVSGSGAVLTASPPSVPANGSSTSSITLSDAVSGHQVRLISSRGSVDTFNSAIGTVNGSGQFVSTIRSSTPGVAIITVKDLTSGQTLVASDKVTFTPTGSEPAPQPPIERSIKIVGVNSQAPLDSRFLEKISLVNRINATVDWQGTQPGSIDFMLNGVSHRVSASINGASYSFDMGNDLKPGFNTLSIVAYNASGQASQSLNYRPYLLEKPVWMSALQAAGALAEFVLNGPISVGREYKTTFKFPAEGISLKAPGFGPPGSTSNLSFFAGGSVRLGLECDQPIILTGLAGAKHKLDLMGVELGGELKGSGQIIGGVVQCRIPTTEGNLRLDIKVYGQKNWPVLTFIIDFVSPGAGTSLEQTLRSAGLYKLTTILGELYLQGNLSGFIESGVRLQAVKTAPLVWTGIRVGGGPGIETGYQFKQLGAVFKVFLGANGEFTFENPNPLTNLSDLHFKKFSLKGKGGWELKPPLFNCTYGKTYQLEWTYPPAHSEVTLLSEKECKITLFGATQQGPYAIFQAPPNTFQAFSLASTGLGAMDNLTAQSTFTNVLISNVYSFAEPALAFNPSTNSAILTWVHNDIAKLASQSQEIQFSRWNGSAWSVPAQVTNDTQLDGAPKVAWAGDGNAVAVWQRLVDTLPLTATWDVTNANKIEIATSVFSPTTGVWSPVTLLTTNTVLDLNPQLARNSSGQLLAAWRQNQAGLLGGDATNPDRIMVAFYNGSWSAPATAMSNIPDLLDLDVGYGNGAATIAYTRYLTPTGYATPTLQLFTSTWNGATWSTSIQLTNDALGHRKPRVVYNTANQPLLVWLAGANLRLRNLTTGVVVSLTPPAEVGDIDEFRVVQEGSSNIAAIFTAQAEQRDLYTSFYDQVHNLWGNPIHLTNDRASEAYPAPALDSAGRLIMGYTATAINSITETTTISDTGEVITYTLPIEGQTNLVTLSHDFVRNLILSNTEVTISNDHPAPGSNVVISATVHNSGDLALEGVAVGFYDGDPAAGGTLIGISHLSTPLPGGFTATLTSNYNVPATGGARTLYAVADPTNSIIEADETDNKASLLAFGPDLELFGTIEYWGGSEVELQTLIRNIGTSAAPATTLAVYRDTITGTLILTKTIPSLTANEVITLTIPWNFGSLGEGSYELVGIVNQVDFTETFTSNNIATLTLDVRPDLMVNPYYLWTSSLEGTTVAITTTVFNIGSAPATDVTVGFYKNAALDAEAFLFTQTIPSLAPGGTVELNGEVSGPLTSGVYILVDPNLALVETTRVNNLAAISEGDKNSDIFLPIIFKK